MLPGNTAARQKMPGDMKVSAEKHLPRSSNTHVHLFPASRFNIDDVMAKSTNLSAVTIVNQDGARSFIFRTISDAMTYKRSAATSIYAPRCVHAPNALAAAPSDISVRHITAITRAALTYSSCRMKCISISVSGIRTNVMIFGICLCLAASIFIDQLRPHPADKRLPCSLRFRRPRA